MSVSEKFLIEGNDMILNLGGNRFINCPRIVTINDFEILSMKKEEEGYITLNLCLFDKYQSLIGIIDENQWTFDTTNVWDMEYKIKHLTIKNREKEISFDIRIENGEIFMRGKFFYMGLPITVSENELSISTHQYYSNMKNCVFRNLFSVLNYQFNIRNPR